MIENDNNTKATLWVAIDVSKHKHDILIEYPNKTRKRMIIASCWRKIKENMKKVYKILYTARMY